MRVLSLSIFIFAVSGIAFSQNAFQEAFDSRTRSTSKSLNIKFSDELGNSGSLPVLLINGQDEGPVFTMIAGVHGFEYPPIMALQDLIREIDYAKLAGTLVIVPIANTASFYSRTPFINPQDRKNLNNSFPGKDDGSITEQIAYFITTSIISVSDILLDVHGGDACEDLIPFVCYYDNVRNPDQTALAKKLSESSGFQYVISYPYSLSATEPAKYAFKQAVQDGKTALSIECGRLGNVQKENVNLIKKGIYNMLAELGMYGKGSGRHKNIIYRNSQTYISANVNGIFYSHHKAGDQVKKNDIVGHTTDVFGNIIEEYKASKDGIILYMLATPPINEGDTVMCISSHEDVGD